MHSDGFAQTVLIKLAKRSSDTEVVCAHEVRGQRVRGSHFLLEMMSGAQRSDGSASWTRLLENETRQWTDRSQERLLST